MVVGGRVQAPLGSRKINGYVLAITETADVPASRVKPLLAVKSSEPAFTDEQAALSQWLAGAYLCPLSEALRPCLAGSGAAAQPLERHGLDRGDGAAARPHLQCRAGVCAEITPARGTTQIRRRFDDAGVATLDTLRREGLIHPVGVKKPREKAIRAVHPALSPAFLHEVADGLSPRAAKQGGNCCAGRRSTGRTSPPPPADVARLARAPAPRWSRRA